jgi:hypothetical protein
MVFDGSDVGIGGFVIDAFALLPGNKIAMSFTAAGNVPGVAGTVDESDVVLFTATSLGDATAGAFTMYFDGSDVGLSVNAENIDALDILPNGHLLISTTGSASVTGASAAAEDVLEFTPTALGPTTAGSWALYFDGSDVALSASSENVDALAVAVSGKVTLSTTGNFAVSGLSGTDEDAFGFNPSSLGGTTTGTYDAALMFDGSAFGLSANDVGGIDVP